VIYPGMQVGTIHLEAGALPGAFEHLGANTTSGSELDVRPGTCVVLGDSTYQVEKLLPGIL